MVGKIRAAVIEDTPDVMSLMHKFAKQYLPEGSKPLCQEGAMTLVTHSIQTGCCLVAEEEGQVTGTVVGVLQTHPFLDAYILSEIALYSTGYSGVKLMKAFVELGREHGADAVTASTLSAHTRADSLMTRLGMTKVEQAWMVNL